MKVIPKSLGGYLVIYVGDCADCLDIDLTALQRHCRAHKLELVLLTMVSRKGVGRFERVAHLNAPAIFDPHRRLIQRLHAYWPGRLFLLSSHWKLLWLQAEPRSGFDPFIHPKFQLALRRVSN